MRKIQIFEEEELFLSAARLFQTFYQKEVEKKGFFTVALSGGKTSIPLFQTLVLLQEEIDWKKIYFFFTDERGVPFTDKRNNGYLAKRYFIDPLHIAEDHVFYIPTNQDAKISAIEYEKVIKSFFQKAPRFDLILLGIGEDGHTASLFDLKKQKSQQLVIAVKKEKEEFSRISFTFFLINQAKRIIFLVKGREKAGILKKILIEKKPLPAGMVQAKNGNVYFLLDKKAAAFL